MPRSGAPEGYVEVSERWAKARAEHPDARLQGSYEVVQVGEAWFIVYTARAYRSPDDAMPGVGVAWEPVPGKTPYTKDSEMMNAETSAWGRALVAAGMADAREGIASANEVRNRRGEGPGKTGAGRGDERPSGPSSPRTVRQPQPLTDRTRTWFVLEVKRIAEAAGYEDEDGLRHTIVSYATGGRTSSSNDLTTADLEALRDQLKIAAQQLGVPGTEG